jgi:hypothetical protein
MNRLGPKNSIIRAKKLINHARASIFKKQKEFWRNYAFRSGDKNEENHNTPCTHLSNPSRFSQVVMTTESADIDKSRWEQQKVIKANQPKPLADGKFHRLRMRISSLSTHFQTKRELWLQDATWRTGARTFSENSPRLPSDFEATVNT